ncbi:putative reverse transcriptase domain-containing protein [Tanacetum coccineum]
MTRSTTKKLAEPLDEPEREFRRRRRAAWRQQQNESLAIAGRNLFDDESSSSTSVGVKSSIPLKTLREHSLPNSAGYAYSTFPSKENQKNGSIKYLPPKSQHGSCSSHDSSITSSQPAVPRSYETRSFDSSRELTNPSKAPGSDRGKLDQFAHFCFSSLSEEEGWNRIEEYVQYQDGLWDDPPPFRNVSSILEIIKPTFEGRLERACKQISYHTTPMQRKSLKNPYLICGGAYEADECDQNKPPEQVSLSGGDIYDDLSLLRFYQNDDVPPWGNSRWKEEGEKGPEWGVRSKFEDDLSGFMLEKSFHTKGLGEMLDLHRRGIHEQFSQILTATEKSQTPTPKPDAPTFAITTRSGTSTRDPPYPTAPRPTTIDPTRGTAEKGIPEDHEPTVVRNEEIPQSPTYYHPSKSSSVPFPSRLKNLKNNDNDERLLFIFKQIHINLPFLEAMIHMPKGAKVLKDLLSHKEKLKKAASSVKLSEELKNTLANLGDSIDLMPHSLFLRLGIFELKPTRMSIQLADRSVKYPFVVCENLLVKINKFIFPDDFVVLEKDEDDLVLIILGRPFLAIGCTVIDVHEGKLSLRVGSETVTFNIGKSMRLKYSHDDYLYCADHTAKIV